jgi:hypothetical protein
MLQVGNFDTIKYSRELWCSSTIQQLNIFIRDFNIRILDSEVNNKVYFIYIPFDYFSYQKIWNILEILKNIRVLGYYLNKNHVSAENDVIMISKLRRTFPLEKIIIYTERLFEELSDFYHDAFFEYMKIDK